MQMTSRKDLNSAELETVRISRCPTLVTTANGEMQTQEEAAVHVKELDMFLTVKILEDTPAVLSLGKLCEDLGYSYEWANGQKPWLIKDGVRIDCNTENYVPIVFPVLSRASSASSSSTTPKSSPQESERSRRIPVSIDRERADEPERVAPTKNSKIKKNEDHERERVTPFSSELPESLLELSENLVDESVPEPHGARVPVPSDSQASSSHEPSLEPMRRVVSGNHSIYTHFPTDRNYKICQKTRITWSLRRKRINGVVPRADKIGDLTEADHKILRGGCESRNNHRYAIVVQDLASQWIQSYPCNAKTSQETERSLQKFLEPSRKPKVIYTDNSVEFGKACEHLSWNHCTSTPHRSGTKRDCCDIVAIGIGRKLVGLLFTKYSGQIV